MAQRRFAAALLLSMIGFGYAAPGGAQSPPSTSVSDGYDRTIAAAKAEMLINPGRAQMVAARAEQAAGAITEPTKRALAVATAQWLQGEALLRIGKNKQASIFINRALATAVVKAPNSKLHADILLSRGGAESSQGRVATALVDYQAAFSLYRRLKDDRGKAMSLLFMAWLYTEAMDQPTALRYYRQALDTYRLDPGLSVSIYNNRATAFSELHQRDRALGEFQSALAVAKQLGSAPLQTQVYANLALLMLATGDLARADSAINEGLRLTADHDAAGLRAGIIAVAAQLALQRSQLPRAVTLITQAFAEQGPNGTSLSSRDMHQIAYRVFLATGDAKSALTHLQAMKRLDDDATKLATSTKTALMAARFDFANQELKISQLKAADLQRTVAFERTRAETQRYIFLGVAGAVAVVIALLAFGVVTLRRSRDQVRAANDDLAVTNSALGKALAAKTEFLATTSHEIRTPLNGILGMTQVMLADARLTPMLRDRLGVVHGAGLTMRALVDDILDVAKMETGNLTIESAPFDLCATVTDATRMWEEQARAKGLAFEVDLGGCPAMIMGDAARVRQIVFNLLSNALKFTKAGKIALAIDIHDDGQLRVAVADSGIGIPADKLEEIFESFRQADAGTTRQFGGTGLGLSICRNLARAMGGDVSVTSVEGQGATFTLVLPLVRAAAAVRDDANLDTQAATLVVDRNPITRSMFRTLLAPHGGPIVFAVSAEEALVRLAEHDVTRMLIDDATIRADGDPLGALARIAEVAATTGTESTLLWPVSAVSEHAELLATGVTRVVAKPVSGAALIRAMFTESVAKYHAIPDLVSNAA